MFKNLFCLVLFLFFSFIVAAQRPVAAGKDSAAAIRIKTIPSNYYTQHLGVVCKQELRMQKSLGLNLFFRLGSKDQVDYMEQKPRAVRRIP